MEQETFYAESGIESTDIDWRDPETKVGCGTFMKWEEPGNQQEDASSTCAGVGYVTGLM